MDYSVNQQSECSCFLTSHNPKASPWLLLSLCEVSQVTRVTKHEYITREITIISDDIRSYLERKRDADGTRMEREWNANGTQMESKRDANGTQMERKQNADGTQTKRNWNANGMRMERKWNAFTKTFRMRFLLGYF